MPAKSDSGDMPAGTLTRLARDLIDDYHLLRKGKLSVREARARTNLAREAMRAVHLQFEGLRFMSEQAKRIGGSSQ